MSFSKTAISGQYPLQNTLTNARRAQSRHKNKVQHRECSCGRNHIRITGIRRKFVKDSHTESNRISDIAKIKKIRENNKKKIRMLNGT